MDTEQLKSLYLEVDGFYRETRATIRLFPEIVATRLRPLVININQAASDYLQENFYHETRQLFDGIESVINGLELGLDSIEVVLRAWATTIEGWLDIGKALGMYLARFLQWLSDALEPAV